MCNKTSTDLSDRRTYKHFAAVIKKQELEVLASGAPQAQLPEKPQVNKKVNKELARLNSMGYAMHTSGASPVRRYRALAGRSGMSKFSSAHCVSAVSFRNRWGRLAAFFQKPQLLQLKLQLQLTCRLAPASRQLGLARKGILL